MFRKFSYFPHSVFPQPSIDIDARAEYLCTAHSHRLYFPKLIYYGSRKIRKYIYVAYYHFIINFLSRYFNNFYIKLYRKLSLRHPYLWHWLSDYFDFVFQVIRRFYTLELIGFFFNSSISTFKKFCRVNLNFRRKRFFPDIVNSSGRTLFTMSLGIAAKFLKKNKAFTKKKQVFLLLASFLRKILLYSSLTNIMLVIKRVPMFLNEILSVINNPVVNPYLHPYTKSQVNELITPNPFRFTRILFTIVKPYGPVKTKNKGRLKRKITKKLNLIGRVSD